MRPPAALTLPADLPPGQGRPSSHPLSRLLLALYLATLALLPWSWFPPFPFLHQHAQWSDSLFALTAIVWLCERWRLKQWPRLNAIHGSMAAYLICAALSVLLASPDKRAGAVKLVGIAELCALAFITSDLAHRPGATRAVGRVVTLTSLAVAVAGVAGLILFYAGVSTRLIGTYGDLQAAAGYARIEAGFYQPNLLASYCLFAFAVVSRQGNELPPWLRRLTLAAVSLALLLTFSRGILALGLAAAIGKATTRGRRIFAAAYALGGAVVIFLLTFYNLSLDVSHPLAAHLEHGATSSRYQAISSSLATLAAGPLAGAGVGALPGVYQVIPFDAHLTPLNIAATMGLPALIAFVVLMTLLVRRRHRPTDLALWGGLAALALDGLAQDVEDFRHVWVMIGLALADADGLEVRPPPDSREAEMRPTKGVD